MNESNDEYHADLTRQSNSMLTVLAKRNGPQLYDGYYVSRTLPLPEQTEAMALGEMVHCMGLEPTEFCHRFAVMPDGLDRVRKAGKIAWRCFESQSRIDLWHVVKPDINRRTNAGKYDYAKWCDANTGKEIISFEDYEQAELFIDALESTRGKKLVKRDDIETAEGCANAILSHDEMHILSQEAMVEKRIDFELDGVEMRCKPDWVSLLDGIDCIVDIKTTQDASPIGFARSAEQFGYYRQAWLYREAIRITMGIDCRFIFACVETIPPYSVACYEPSEAMMAAGEHDLRSLLAEYRYRYEADDWMQDWSVGINRLDLPPYFKKRTFTDMRMA